MDKFVLGGKSLIVFLFFSSYFFFNKQMKGKPNSMWNRKKVMKECILQEGPQIEAGEQHEEEKSGRKVL